jgi:phosphohistidine phosphatase SixA
VKKIVLVRHGHSYLGELSRGGIEQVYRLTRTLRRVVFESDTKTAFSSPRKRTMQSAAIIMQQFGFKPGPEGFTVNQQDCLDVPDDVSDLEGILKLLEDAKEDVVFLVTHAPCLEFFPRYFGEKVLGAEFPEYCVDEYAMAVIIDCEKKSCQLISFDSQL